ncbi:MAG: LuxR C-terminal-related transcriptional regulator [Cyanobacteria bacterium P01_B01_bin.77]
MVRPVNPTHQQTIDMIEAGKKNQEIANALGISVETVKTRRRRYNQTQKTKQEGSNPTVAITAKPSSTKAEHQTPPYPQGSNLVIFTKSDQPLGGNSHLVSERSQEPIDLNNPFAKVDEVQLPNMAQIKKAIWLMVTRNSNPALQIQAVNAYMRALHLEQSLPSEEKNTEIMTEMERDTAIAEIIEHGRIGLG